MSLTCVPFAEQHLEEAAALFAARQRADRGYEPDFPERLTDPARAHEAVDRDWRADDQRNGRVP